MKNKLNRRDFFATSLKSALSMGSLPLTSLATGLPVTFLMSLSQPARAQEALTNPQYLILSHIQGADPINTNAPGTYPENDDDDLNLVVHPDPENFQIPAEFSLGDQTVKAAQPWADLPEAMRQRFGFWHHATHTVAHNDFATVRRVNSNVRGVGNQGTIELAEFFAEQIGPALGTLVNEPFSVGGSSINAFGGDISQLNPLDIKELFTQSSGNISQMAGLRDKFIDRAYQTVQENGTPAQMRFLERYAASRAQASSIGDSLGDLIADISSNDAIDQMRVSIALMRLNITPVVTMGLPFGGDNHSDPDLEDEILETESAIPALIELWTKLTEAPDDLIDKVTFASLNPFGRQLISKGNGRNHNENHHTMLVCGSGIRGGVVGGIEPSYKDNNSLEDFKATSIDSSTGASVKNDGGDIAFEDTFASVSKTLAHSLGIPETTVDERIQGGQIIKSALA